MSEDLLELDVLRAKRTLERMCPGLDMTPPYGQYAIDTLARFLSGLRELTITQDSEVDDIQKIFDKSQLTTKEELGLTSSDDALRLMEANVAAVAGMLAQESVAE